MILICGIATEPPIALAIEAAARGGFEHLVFNQRQAEFFDIALDHDKGVIGGYLWAHERQWPLSDFTGIYARLLETSALPENRPGRSRQPDPARVARSEFLHQTLSTWVELADCRVVNRLRAVSSNVSKPYQTQLISKYFRVPATLITNEPDEVREFARVHKRVIYKSISSVRSIVRELSSADLNDLRKLRALPTQFQAFVSGTNVRVHVVGQKVFATEVTSAAVDYRYAQRDGFEVEMRAVELPGDIAQKCRELSAVLELPFCGIDLKRTDDGIYYCFEVNPSPAYSYYQQYTGQPISDALVDYLAGVSD